MTNQTHKKGFTLVEMIITIGLFTIIIAIAVGAFTSALRTQRQVSSLIAAQSNISLALEQMAREVRTGYLFCNNSATNNIHDPAGSCDPCTISVASSTWTCPALDFYDAEGNQVLYSLQNGALMETINGGTPQSVTGDTVSVKYLQFLLFGQLEGDQWTPRITITMGITPSSTDPGVESTTFNLETTVSARNIDCKPSGGAGAC